MAQYIWEPNRPTTNHFQPVVQLRYCNSTKSTFAPCCTGLCVWRQTHHWAASPSQPPWSFFFFSPALQPQLVLNSRFFCLNLLTVWVTDMWPVSRLSQFLLKHTYIFLLLENFSLLSRYLGKLSLLPPKPPHIGNARLQISTQASNPHTFILLPHHVQRTACTPKVIPWSNKAAMAPGVSHGVNSPQGHLNYLLFSQSSHRLS